jgi:hypothetical protein
MRRQTKRQLLFCCLVAITCSLFAGETLKSVEEEYYDFLVLEGAATRPTLNYRTLTDSVWTITDPSMDIWADNDLGKSNPWGDATWRLYGPSIFTSYNSTYPYGQNDGALWQGKGANVQLRTGIMVQTGNFTFVLKPELDFSQNLYYEIMAASNTNGYSEYGYYGDVLVDQPQRFGDDPFFTYDWGDSEIRYTAGSFTVGFGTQAIWLGPAYLNPILHSNNAATYPKLDFGFTDHTLYLPWLGWEAGNVELRMWVGKLGYSEYYKEGYDTDEAKMISGFALSFQPKILPGLTLSFNHIYITDYEYENLGYLFRLLVPNWYNGDEDGKGSVSFSYLLPAAGIEVYGELGMDDYLPGDQFQALVRYPFHTMVYLWGMKKTVTVRPQDKIYGELVFEWSNMEMSQDGQTQWAYYFYSHGDLGYTNDGQIIGAGTGYAGNSQYLAFKLYYPKGTSTLYVQRSNPDNNYIYAKMVGSSATTGYEGSTEWNYFSSFKASFALGLETDYFLDDHLTLHGALVYNMVLNDRYKQDEDGTVSLSIGENTVLHNFRAEFGLSYRY